MRRDEQERVKRADLTRGGDAKEKLPNCHGESSLQRARSALLAVRAVYAHGQGQQYGTRAGEAVVSLQNDIYRLALCLCTT